MGADEDGEGEELPEQVDADEARALVAGGKVRVIDIRSADDFAEERITGSTHMDPEDVADELGNDPAERERGVLILCEDGGRSAELAEELRDGDHQVTSIDGGFKAWVGDHLPTAPTPDEEYEGPKVTLPGAVAPSEGDEDEDDEDSGEEAEPGEDGERVEPRSEETADEKKADQAEER
jgi:rhodanese-related sulfurtransferase